MYPAVGQAGIQYGVQMHPAQLVGVSNRDVRELRVCSNSPCTRPDCKFVHVPTGNNNNWIYNGAYYDYNFYRRNPQSQRQPIAGKEIPEQDEWKDVVLPADDQFYLSNDFYSKCNISDGNRYCKIYTWPNASISKEVKVRLGGKTDNRMGNGTWEIVHSFQEKKSSKKCIQKGC